MKYYNLKEIEKLNLPTGVLFTLKEGLNSKVYYNYNNVCKIGILKGILYDDKYYYIIEKDGKEVFTPYWIKLDIL